jgi:hypothetical protein
MALMHFCIAPDVHFFGTDGRNAYHGCVPNRVEKTNRPFQRSQDAESTTIEADVFFALFDLALSLFSFNSVCFFEVKNK